MVVYFNDGDGKFLKLIITKGSPFSSSYEGVVFLKNNEGIWEEVGPALVQDPISRGIHIHAAKKKVVVKEYFIEKI